MKSGACTHIDAVDHVKPAKAYECEECVKIGGEWVQLRICLNCGHVGCCDNSPNRHATAHHRATKHPVITSGEAGETWSYCYTDDKMLSP